MIDRLKHEEKEFEEKRCPQRNAQLGIYLCKLYRILYWFATGPSVFLKGYIE